MDPAAPMTESSTNPRSRSEQKAIERWLAALSPQVRRPLAWTIGLGLTAGLLIVLQSALLAWIINRVVMDGAGLDQVWPALAGLLPLFLLRFVLAQAGERTAFAAGAEIRRTLRARLTRHIQALGPAWLKGQSSGDLANGMVDGIDALEGFFTRWLPNRALTTYLPLAILVVVFPSDWVSGLVLVITAPLIPIFMILIGLGAEELNQKQWGLLARLSARFLDTLQGLTTIRLFNAGAREAAIVAWLSEAYRQSTMKVLRVAFLSSVVLEFLSTISIAVVAVLIGFRLLYGHMHFQPGFFVLLLAPEFYLPLRTLGTHYHARMEAIGAAERIMAVLETPVPDQSAAVQPLQPATAYSLRFDHVSCRYDGDTPALDGFDLEVPAGAVTALVGASGAGKSTALNLLLGFVAHDSGRVLINDQDLATLDPQGWLRHVAWVPQRAHVFSGSVLDNIRLGMPNATPEAVREAARQAGADAFIEALPAGYDTPLGERGAGLSGGQIQRLALARAFLKDAPIVLLDEPTANLDGHSQAQIHQAIARLAKGRTILLVAHRLGTVRLAQRIAVMDQGRVVEVGDHDSLLARNGRYAQLLQAEVEA